MNFLLANLCSLVFGLSEAALVFARRARAQDAQLKDEGSLGLLWAVIALSVFLAFGVSQALPDLSFGPLALPVTVPLGVLCFALGLGLRWYSILYLGRYFTVNVAIAADHRVIDTGPYRLIRHPSYSGALAAFLGLGLLLNNGASLLVILLPTFLVFRRRMRIEEAALLAGLGDAYRAYLHRTRRLIPGVY